MGACVSCLGERDEENVDEHAQLLDDSHASYGVFTDQNNSVTNDADAAVVQQENEELRGIVGATSSNLIDIFAVTTQPSPFPIGAVARVDRRNVILAGIKNELCLGSVVEDEGVNWGSNEEDSADEEDDIVKPAQHMISTFASGRAKVR